MNEAKMFRGSTSPIIPPRLFREQLVQFCDIVQKNDCSSVLVSPQPIDTTRDYPTFSGAIIKDETLINYGEIMRDVAEDAGWPYVNTREVFASTGLPTPELIARDGYHPNALGHAALAQAVGRVLSM